MRRALVVMALLLSTRAVAYEQHWTKEDVAWELVFAGTVAADAYVTRRGLRAGGYTESNPLLGERPSDARLLGMSVVAVLAHAGVTQLLPQGRWRRTWQSVWVGVELGMVASNVNLLIIGGDW